MVKILSPLVEHTLSQTVTHDLGNSRGPLILLVTMTTTQNNNIQGGSNMTGTDLRVNKPHCAAAVRP